MTPLDQITLKLKAIQEEYEDRTELLALLKSRLGQEQIAAAPQGGGEPKNSSAGLKSPPAVQSYEYNCIYRDITR